MALFIYTVRHSITLILNITCNCSGPSWPGEKNGGGGGETGAERKRNSGNIDYFDPCFGNDLGSSL